MKIIEKRDFIHRHLHKVEEPATDELYNKMASCLNESDDDIQIGNLTSHAAIKQEWRATKK